VLRARPDLADALAIRLGAPRGGAAVLPMLRCPVCRVEMDRGRFAATSTVVIDACPHQHGLWLDAGELGEVLRYARHREAVGVHATRREADLAEQSATGWNADRARLESEVLRLQARQATDQWNAKRASLLVFAIVVLLRVVWFWANVHEAKNHARLHEGAETLPVSTLR